MFIAAGRNKLEASFNEHFAEMLGGRTLWVVPEVEHMGAYLRIPEEYEQRIFTFFDNYLLNTGTEPSAE